MVSRVADTFYAYDPKHEASLQKFCLRSFAGGHKSLLNSTVSEKFGAGQPSRSYLITKFLCPPLSQLAKIATEQAINGGHVCADRVKNLIFFLRRGHKT